MAVQRFALAAAMAALPFAAHAADATLAEVVVKGGKEDASVTVVPKAELQALRPATSDTASLLREVPGVSLQAAGGASSLPVMHGLADDRLRIKVDDMDLIASCPNHMNPALSYLDPSHVASLKVYAGITPVSVGGDSIGGTILAETPAPRFAAPGQGSVVTGEVGAFYRSNGHANGANLSATLAGESISIRYAGATAQADNYEAAGDFKQRLYSNPANASFTGRADHTLSADEVGSTAYETRNHTLGVALRGGNHLLEGKLGYQKVPHQLYPNQRMDMLDNEQKRASLRYLGQFDWGVLEARVYHEKVDHYMDFGDDKRWWYGADSGGNGTPNAAPCSPLSATCAAAMPMYTEGKTTGAVLKTTIDLTQHDLLHIGGEYQMYRLDDWWPASGGGMWPHTFWNIRHGERERRALFGEWEKRYTPQWMMLLGVRYEHVQTDAGDVQGYNTTMMNQAADARAFNASDRSRADNNWDLTALARYTRDAGMDVDFGFARKVRSPNLYERYTWSTATMMMIMNNTVGDGNGYVGDVNLKPEKAHTVSATFDWHAADRSWEFKATPYYTHVDDYIDAVRCSAAGMGGCAGAYVANPSTNTFVRLKYANQTARLYGIDLSGKMQIASTGIGDLGLKGVLAYTNGKNTDTGDALYHVMPLNARLVLTHRLAGWNNAIELVMVKSKSDVSEVRNEMQTPGYSLVNLRGSYAWKQVRLDFGVENVFDKFYYLPNGGAYLGQGTTMSTVAAGVVPQWGTGVPGPGRSLYAGVNISF